GGLQVIGLDVEGDRRRPVPAPRDAAVDPSSAASVDQRVAGAWDRGHVPAEQVCVELGQLLVIRAADLEMHHCVCHARPPCSSTPWPVWHTQWPAGFGGELLSSSIYPSSCDRQGRIPWCHGCAP